MALNLLGTQAFLPALCVQISKAAPNQQPIPLDPVILQSILLVLASGRRKNLLLRAVDPEDVGIIARITEWTLSFVFNFSTHRLRVRPFSSKDQDSNLASPNAFLRSLFLMSPSHSLEASHEEGTSSHASLQRTAHYPEPSYSNTRSSLARRPVSRDKPHTDPFEDGQSIPSPSHSRPTSSSHHHSYKRHSRPAYPHHQKQKSGSQPNSAALAAAPPHIPSAIVVSGLEHASDASQRALVRVLADGRVALPNHNHSGLYDLAEVRVHDPESLGVWDLPEDFIMVYITTWDPKNRPAIHKSLLDKFAMSTNVTIQTKTRRALRSFSVASNTGTVVQNPFASQQNSPYLRSHSIQSTPRATPHSLPPHSGTWSQTHIPQQKPTALSAVNTPTSSPIANIHPVSLPRSPITAPSGLEESLSPTLPADFLSRLRYATVHCTHISPTLEIYLQDLFTAARFDCPELDGTLLTARSMEDAQTLVKACRVLGTELGGWELVRSGTGELVNGNEDHQNQDAAGGDGSSANGFAWEFETGYDSSGVVPIELGLQEGTLEGYQAVVRKHFKEKGKVVEDRSPHVTFDGSSSVAPSVGNAEGPALGPNIFDVSGADIARIVPRVISHRVSTRKGWMDQVLAGAACGATFSAEVGWKRGPSNGKGGFQTKPEIGESDSTVKDVLVRILQRV